ncbi:aspartate/glutamate racemase family protein [Paenibacillus amylolyticus]|nr:aspartate/glutamate racemase family protein [Paenibacillus amylolyticus]WFR63159.1 aspartate/glutamate racemase family protein [Paenibacillus amylolyticus]
MSTIACFHAHYSNISVIEQALTSYNLELVHYVDPGLDRLKHDEDFNSALVQEKLSQTLQWMSRCHADAILVTCTLFAAVLEQIQPLPIPVTGIDDSLLAMMVKHPKRYLLAFTNPATVEPTMARYHEYVDQHLAGKDKTELESVLLPGLFDMVMRGDQEGYVTALNEALQQLVLERKDTCLVAAQLSMAPAAKQASANAGVTIYTPLSLLGASLERDIGITKKI